MKKLVEKHKSKVGESKQSMFLFLLFLIMSVTMFVTVIYINWKYGIYRINSDFSSEMILAKLAAESNSPVSRAWYYSTELRLFNTQLIMGLFFKFFDDWILVRTLGNIVLDLLMFGAFYYLIRPMELKKHHGLMGILFLITPVSAVYYDIVQYGQFYTPHYIMIFISFGIFFRLSKPKGYYYKADQRTKLILTIGYAVISLICGLSGIRYILIIQAPIFLASFWNLLFCNRCQSLEKIKQKKLPEEFRTASYSVLGCVFALAGYLINEKVLSKIFSFYSFSEMSFIEFSVEPLLNKINACVEGIICLMGYNGSVKVFSLQGITDILVVFGVCMVVFIIWQILCKKKEENAAPYAQYFLSSFLFNTFIIIFTTGDVISRYYIPVFVLGIPMLLIYLKNMNDDNTFLKYIIMAFIIITCLLSGICTLKIVSTTSRNQDKEGVSAFLVKNDLDFGYATYWNSNVITELTNGKTEISVVQDFNTMSPFNWLTLKEYSEKDYHQGEVFLLLTQEEKEQNIDSEILKKGKIEYEDDYYVVYIVKDNSAVWDFRAK